VTNPQVLPTPPPLGDKPEVKSVTEFVQPQSPSAPAEANLTLPKPEDTQTTSLKENIRELSAEESRLSGELERYKQQEKTLQSQLQQSRQDNVSEKNNYQMQELEEKLKMMQQEKDRAEERAQKLETLITQINTTAPKTSQPREIITPQAATQAAPAPVKVIPPRRAEGKMAPPMTTVPNVINGVVKDGNGLLLPDTIIVVKDKNDEPVRALKTNKVGQFAISTALPNGTYIMEVEKEGFEFDYIEIQLTGEISPPIEIRARARGGA
jgi:hypothetical protein